MLSRAYSCHPVASVFRVVCRPLVCVLLVCRPSDGAPCPIQLPAVNVIELSDWLLGKNGRTALYYAAELNQLDVASVLLEAGARVDVASYSGCLPVQAAMARSHDRIVALLDNAGMAIVWPATH